jgi:hypothetical protein
MPQTTNGETTPLLSGGGGTRDSNDSPWIKYPKHVAHVSWLVLASNYVNVLLVFVPLGIISGALEWNPTAVFCLNFFAIVPLASLLSFATEELSAKLGETIGGLMNASFGNAVELIVSELRKPGGVPSEAHTSVGQYRCAQTRPNPHRSSQYAWQHPLQHAPSSRLLLYSWWLPRRRTVF